MRKRRAEARLENSGGSRPVDRYSWQPFPRRRMPTRRLPIALAVVTVLVCRGACGEQQQAQSDWSSGPGVAGPTSQWSASFAHCDGASWLAIPGQLALASTFLEDSVAHAVDIQAPGAIKVFADDVDSDGDNDVLVASFWDDTITLWYNLGGTPPQWRSEIIAAGFLHTSGVSTADVDGDGRTDILATAGDAAEVAWWRNLGHDPPTWTRYDVSNQVAGAHDVVGADLDADGDTDLVVPACEDDELIWFSNEGGDPIQWSRHLIAGGWDYPCKAAVADIDGDGDLDVAAAAWLDEEVAWWRNDGGDPIHWDRQTIVTGFTGAHWVECADVDGDGRVDVLSAAMNRGEVVWWRNRGGLPTQWDRHTVTSSLRGAVSVHASDIDGDGDLDVAASGWDPAGGVAVFENTGAGLSWRRHPVDPGFGESSSVRLSDVDGDGAVDLLATSWSRNQVRWWELTEFRDHGTLTSSILDTGGTDEWIGWSWEGEMPAGTSLVFEARASEDPSNMGEWSEIGAADLSDQLEDGARYLQYRIAMDGGPTVGSPLLDRIEFIWSSESSPPPRRPRGRLGGG